MDDFEQLASRLHHLLDRLSSQQQRQLTTAIARDMRRQNQQRVRQQINPDGTAFEPRKPRRLRGKQGTIKRQRKMFSKLITARYLRTEADESTAAIRFAGRIANIARIHQEGLRARVEQGGPIYPYPQRQLLGFAEQDKQNLIRTIIKHLAQ